MIEEILAKHTISYTKLSKPSQTSLGKIAHDTDLLRRVIKNSQLVQVYTFQYDVGGLSVMGYMIAPKKIKKRLPTIVYNRGGTEDFGLVKPPFLFTHLAELAQKGYVVIGTQYPGNTYSEGHDERGGKTDIQSVGELYKLINALPYCDAGRIAMYGASRGGMMTYICLKKFTWIKTAVILAGPTDLSNDLIFRPEMSLIYEKAFGNTREGRDARSVMRWIEEVPGEVPIMILHAAGDKLVNPMDSISLAEVLLEKQKTFQLHILDSKDHTLAELGSKRNKMITDWLSTNL